MANVAHAKKTTVSQTTECSCGWGRHCLCLSGRDFAHELERAARLLISSGGDLGNRRRAHDSMRETIDLIDQRNRDSVALGKLYDSLPRWKDIDLVRRILNDDRHPEPWTDEQIAEWMVTPIEHVRDLRTRVTAAFDGRPLPVPHAWRVAARERRAKFKAQYAARRAA
jgi:hypothetical protein